MHITAELQAILAYAKTGTGSLAIEALAGTGKTTALIEVLRCIPQRSILLVAFNKAIADTLAERIQGVAPKTSAVHVKTFHALGRALIDKHLGGVVIDRDTTQNIINTVIGRNRVPFPVRKAATQLLRLGKESMVGVPTGARLLEAGFTHSVFPLKMRPDDVELAVTIAHRGYDVTLSAAFLSAKTIDFCDMVWLPLALNVTPTSRYQAIFIDEMQDISAPQVALIKRVMLPADRVPGTRIIAAGDIHQQIYAWRGSLGEKAWDELLPAGLLRPEASAKLKRLPLTTTWRCATEIVAQANELVPALRAAPDADEGKIAACTMGELPLRLGQGRSGQIHTFVLSRTRADLLDCALYLWSGNVTFMLNDGQGMLAPVFDLLDSVLDLRSPGAFLASLAAWRKRETDKAAEAGLTSHHDHVIELAHMLESSAKHCAHPREIKDLLSAILTDHNTGVLLSTVHKVKGLEAERVFLLRQTFGRHCGKVTGEELNIEYVAITRAREHLVWVDNESFDIPACSRPIAQMSSLELEAAVVDCERLLCLQVDNDEVRDEVTKRIAALNHELAQRG